MTRPADASLAAEIGASYVGAIFASGPRHVSVEAARELFDAAAGIAKVGVFGTNEVREIGRIADALELDVVQLHADPTPDDVHAVRSTFGGEVWAAIRVARSSLPSSAEELMDAADGVVLDAMSPDKLGGTGQILPWHELAPEVSRKRTGGLVILAGGLNPHNVGTALRDLAPDVVDVSSGVEQFPGVKDHQLMRDFADAVGGLERLA
ncbi:MAG: phosphoribosylanthranilate isomerase [Gemmatimonadota bacterium]|nr:phosphoribosylanthranilate isomerase [Gemmatimonadota bacterium]